jgi:hypothetical protein
VASSAEARPGSSPTSRSRSAADGSGGSACLGGVHGLRLLAKAPRGPVPPAPLPLGFLLSVPFPAVCASSPGWPARSGASRSSSPAIPTRLNRE